MDKTLRELVTRLQTAYAESLVSVVLYGSAATGNHHRNFSDFNILCVLTELTPRELAAASATFRWWRDKGSPAPLLLSERELNTCTDCFAIEFHDIREHHRVLYGKDVVSALPVDDSFYRAQVEHELRAKLLRLRQKAAGVMGEGDLVARLLAEALSTFCVLFRHALALHGEPAPAAKRDIIESASRRFAFDGQPFRQLLDLREERIRLRDLEPLPLLASYLKGIEAVTDAVDRLEK